MRCAPSSFLCFFCNDTATTEIYTLSLHDALPISLAVALDDAMAGVLVEQAERDLVEGDRKSTRLNSSHTVSSYAVFCVKKKKQKETFMHKLEITTTIMHLPFAFFLLPGLFFIPNKGYQRQDGFFFKETATIEIYTLSLHDARPI